MPTPSSEDQNPRGDSEPELGSEHDSELDELRDLLDEGVAPEPEVPLDEGAAQPEPGAAQYERSAPQPDPGSVAQPEAVAAQPVASAPQYDQMRTHRIVVGVFMGLNGLVIGGGAVAIAVLLGAFAEALGGSAASGLVALAGILGLAVLVTFTLAAFRFARYGDRGGLVVGWITGVVYLIAFPVGTPIGAYMIWVLTRPNSAPPAPFAQPLPAPAR